MSMSPSREALAKTFARLLMAAQTPDLPGVARVPAGDPSGPIRPFIVTGMV